MSINRVNLDGSTTPVCGGTMYADLPVGAIIPFFGSIVCRDFLPCDGRAVSRREYAELFAVIGNPSSGDGVNTFNVPDLRETVPVGIGENGTQTIAAHDSYTLGEFKDDQLQNITGELIGTTYPNHAGWGNDWTGAFKRNNTYWSGSAPNDVKPVVMYNADFDASRVARAGTTTHGKQLGVNYIIKAKSTAVPYDYKEYIDNKLEEGGFDAPFNLKEYIQNQNILSEYETAPAQFTAEYDGFISAGAVGTGAGVEIKINGVSVAINSNADYGANSVSASFKKGDVIVTTSSTPKVAYYKLRDYSER